MDFGLSEDQQLLDETIRSFLADKVPITRVRELRNRERVNDPAIWKDLAELGMTGILIPEEQGGSNLSLLDAALVSQALGYAATPCAFLSSAIMVPVALKALGAAKKNDWLAGIASGELGFGVAVTEVFSVREQAGVLLEAGSLRGKAMMAIDAIGADLLLVAIGSDTLAVVRADSSGLGITPLATLDQTRGTTELVFDGVVAEAVFEKAGAAIDQMLVAGRIALAADVLGCCETLVEQAVEYAKQRKQFERVIGSFQAVKHMLANVQVAIEYARPAVYRAAHSVARDVRCRAVDVSMAKRAACEAAEKAARTALQVHGAIGYTWEQDVHVWMRRAWSLAGAWGDAAWHTARVAAAVLDRKAPADTFGYSWR